MKLSIILSTLFLMLIAAQPSYASMGSGDDRETSTMVSASLKRMIDKHMVFPVFQPEEMHGTVEISFKIDDEGKVKILNVQSSNPDLVDYVVKKLKKIQLDKQDENIGKTVKYRFVFKKQA